MRLALVLALVGTSAAFSADPKTLAVPAEKTAAAKALIAKLDTDEVPQREKATADLKAMGRHALPALLAAANGKPADRDVAVLNELLQIAREGDYDARAEVFLADKDGKYDHDLPGWNELKAAVKDTKESRLLMADILRDGQCRDMLILAFDRSDTGRKLFEKRWEAKRDEWYAVFKAERDAGLPAQGAYPKADAPIHWLPAALLADLIHGRDYRSDFRPAIVRSYLDHADEAKLAVQGKGRYGEVFRELVKFWIAQQKERFGLEIAGGMAEFMKIGHAEVIACQEKLFELFVSGGERNGAFGPLAGTRDPKYIASFRRLFDRRESNTTKQFNESVGEIQVRDAALSMCIALSGQDPEEYGYSAQIKTKATDDLRYWTENYFFKDGDGKTAAEKRAAAFKKWAEWEKANPDAIKAKAPEKK